MLNVQNKEFIKSMVVALIIALSINTFIFNITYVKGDSMNPSLKNKDRLLVKKYGVVFKTEEYERGDIIVFKSPDKDDNRLFIKRIVALPGERINIIEGRVFVNDRLLDETYIAEGSFTDSLSYGEEYVVGEGEIFVLGDNRVRGASNDSRLFKGVDIDDIKGKVILRIYPFNRISKDL